MRFLSLTPCSLPLRTYAQTLCVASVVILAWAMTPLLGIAQDGGAMPTDKAQRTAPPVNQASLSFAPALPSGKFQDALNDRTAYGIDAYYGRLLPISTPLYIGASIGIAPYESQTFGTGLSVNGRSATLENRQILVQPHASVRYQPVIGEYFRPFVEGLIGANVLMSSNTVLVDGEETNVDGIDDEASTTFSAGLGAGIDIRLFGVTELGVFGLTVSGQFIYGAEADVTTAVNGLVTEPVNAFESRVVGIDRNVVASPTSLFRPEIGLHFEF